MKTTSFDRLLLTGLNPMLRAEIISDKVVSVLCRCFTDSQLHGSSSCFLPRLQDQLLQIQLQPFLFHQDHRTTVSTDFTCFYIHSRKRNASACAVLSPVDIYKMLPGSRAHFKQGPSEKGLFLYEREVGFIILFYLSSFFPPLKIKV